ncbi:Aerobic C4-dicarboxylate transport protein [Corynebacterium kalinowskii]|uniref:Aerobic C4-dicarboxylate transport protein n=1 Tax=Corynebacterium kalinowskii TaxID=2675216 RepID=A0A6B8VVI6_9CORY|nr:cation:dicarboxylase symporter family transporter [Corynebacterium kalinowskii]QGU01310.1 Aerobic C4-dicarboxylate transport protein [Corynebacterium kalinowskii]
MSHPDTTPQGAAGAAVAASPRIAEPKKPRKDRTHWLYIMVIIAIVGGIAFGLLAPEQAKGFKVLGELFVALIKMMISPIIFCTIVLGIGSVRAAASVGKAGGIALAYFITMSTFALAIGLVVGNLIDPGTGLNIEATKNAGQKYAEKAEHAGGTTEFIKSIIPDTLFSSLTAGSVLQTLFVALLFGFAVQNLGRAGEPILGFIAHLQKVVFKILTMVLWLAPIGAFGAIAGVVGGSGIEAVKQMALLMVAFYITCVLFIFVVLGLVLKIFAGFNIFKLCKYLGREFLLIVATSSSESALPNLMRKMEHIGVSKSTVGIVVPTGYSFNLDGTAIYLTMASIFIADAMNMPLSLNEQIGLLVFMIIASKGAAGVSGAGLATLAGGLHAHRPELLDGVGIIVGIDRLMSEARALTNFAGNSVATLIVGTWTKTIDKQRVKDVLDGKIPYVESEADVEVDLRNPEVENSPNMTLQPTPQVDLDAYKH